MQIHASLRQGCIGLTRAVEGGWFARLPCRDPPVSQHYRTSGLGTLQGTKATSDAAVILSYQRGIADRLLEITRNDV